MHLCPGNVVAIERAVVYYARAAHTFSAVIKYRHCSCCQTPVSSQLKIHVAFVCSHYYDFLFDDSSIAAILRYLYFICRGLVTCVY